MPVKATGLTLGWTYKGESPAFLAAVTHGGMSLQRTNSLEYAHIFTDESELNRWLDSLPVYLRGELDEKWFVVHVSLMTDGIHKPLTTLVHQRAENAAMEWKQWREEQEAKKRAKRQAKQGAKPDSPNLI